MDINDIKMKNTCKQFQIIIFNILENIGNADITHNISFSLFKKLLKI